MAGAQAQTSTASGTEKLNSYPPAFRVLASSPLVSVVSDGSDVADLRFAPATVIGEDGGASPRFPDRNYGSTAQDALVADKDCLVSDAAGPTCPLSRPARSILGGNPSALEEWPPLPSMAGPAFSNRSPLLPGPPSFGPPSAGPLTAGPPTAGPPLSGPPMAGLSFSGLLYGGPLPLTPAQALGLNSGPSEGKSFAQAASTSLNMVQLQLEHENFKEVHFINGKPTFDFTDAELNRLAKPLENMAVGKFSLYRPSMSEIRKFFNSLHLLGNFSLGLYDKKHILIHFSDERDLTRVRLRGSYFVNKNPLRIWKWEVGFRPGQESSLTPVWLSFPGLPVEFWGSLKSLASIFGNPFQVDRSTLNFSRPSMARILVDLDAKKQYPDEIYISVNGKNGFTQKVFIENKPQYFKLGHSIHNCYFKFPNLRNPPCPPQNGLEKTPLLPIPPSSPLDLSSKGPGQAQAPQVFPQTVLGQFEAHQNTPSQAQAQAIPHLEPTIAAHPPTSTDSPLGHSEAQQISPSHDPVQVQSSTPPPGPSSNGLPTFLHPTAHQLPPSHPSPQPT
ncbi:hypothetical protein AXF42_Ash013821 [Apostasia shenzhenica]|uniref:DUF4283 domain-containing protein n=1 Tax=Apostasia shenzhenica TaxID=1088818 RepID=A0A2I0A4Y6_9ASPA|nr:hypothetical protein AXF42_Ash013821 [Apostasia shenzhenica]